VPDTHTLFESATLTLEPVRMLLGGKSSQAIRNRVSAGTFPHPTSDEVWPIDEKVDGLGAPKMHQAARNPRRYAHSVQSIIGAIQMEYAPCSIML
jgi:hypothetical protein